MDILKFRVRGQALTLTNPNVNLIPVTDTVNQYLCQFEFSEDWYDLNKVVVFKNVSYNITKEVYLSTSNECYIPWEVLSNSGEIFLEVIGTEVRGEVVTVRIPSTLLGFKWQIQEGLLDVSANISSTPDLFEQFVSSVRSDSIVAATARDEAVIARDVAVQSAADASASELAATSAAESAENSASTASSAASSASESALSVAGVADETKSYAEIASAKAADASTQAEIAAGAKEDAVTAKNDAEAARDAAVVAKNDAETARDATLSAKETFDNNAETKLTAYNQNALEKTASYNTNATEKLNAYNANADNRVAEFNAQTEQIQADVSELKSDLDTLNQGGLNLKEDFIGQQVNKWLDEHPEATTTVQDNSLTIDKMVVGTLGYVTPEMFGAIGNGLIDDTDAINNALQYPNVKLNGNYLVRIKEDGCALNINSNTKIEVNGTIETVGTSTESYSVVLVKNCENVLIHGKGTIKGERLLHTGDGGEHGHVIKIVNSESITVDGLTVLDGWGDGIYIGYEDNDSLFSKDIRVSNVIAKNNRRNNMSVSSVDGLIINNSKFLNANGTSPESGIDFEPNTGNNIMKNIYVNNIELFDNMGYDFNIFWNSINNGYINAVNVKCGSVICLNNSSYANVFIDGLYINGIDNRPCIYYSNIDENSKLVFKNTTMDVRRKTNTDALYNCAMLCRESNVYNVIFNGLAIMNGSIQRLLTWIGDKKNGRNCKLLNLSLINAEVIQETSSYLIPTNTSVGDNGEVTFSNAPSKEIASSDNIGSVYMEYVVSTDNGGKCTVYDRNKGSEIFIVNILPRSITVAFNTGIHIDGNVVYEVDVPSKQILKAKWLKAYGRIPIGQII